MFPLKDDLPSQRFPIVTIGLIVANVAAFVWEIVGGAGHMQWAVLAYGVVPWEVVRMTDLPPSGLLPVPLTIFSSMFLHGGVGHIAGNMLYLWVFGDNIEDAMGKVKFVLFYLLSGVAAAVAQIALAPNSKIPMVGASGAIAGVLGAYLVLYPKARVLTLVPIFYYVRLIYVPALAFLGLWFLMQLFSIPASLGGRGGVAFLAHVGGFVTGLALGRILGTHRATPAPRVSGPRWGY